MLGPDALTADKSFVRIVAPVPGYISRVMERSRCGISQIGETRRSCRRKDRKRKLATLKRQGRLAQTHLDFKKRVEANLTYLVNA